MDRVQSSDISGWKKLEFCACDSMQKKNLMLIVLIIPNSTILSGHQHELPSKTKFKF